VTGAAAEVAEVPEPEPELVPELEPEPELELEPVPEPELVPEPVVAEVTGAVAAEVVLVTAEVTGSEPVPDVVAACACRENTSKTTRIPAAAIATCIARRAMCRKIGCGISSSPPPGQTGPDPARMPPISAPKHVGGPDFRLFSPRSPGTGHLASPFTNGRAVRSSPYSIGSDPGKDCQIAAEFIASGGRPGRR
jgi:hypothetical protein